MVRNQDEVKRIKETYLPGMVVRLVRMDDCSSCHNSFR
jgi:hypothetical protein